MSDQEKRSLNYNWRPPAEKTGGHQKNSQNSADTMNQAGSDPFSPEDLRQIRKAIKEKYAEVAISAKGKFHYLTGKQGAEALGYDTSILNEIRPEMLNSFCGVGNPFSIAEIQSGSIVLDVGSGAGFDLIVASRLTGPGGQVYGIDLTEEMVVKAKENLKIIGTSNVEVKHVDSEEFPFSDNMFDVVISNGVINLSPCKLDIFREIWRVLKPEGRLQFADIVAVDEIPSALAGSLEAWSQ